jgi:hypothetical protein
MFRFLLDIAPPSNPPEPLSVRWDRALILALLAVAWCVIVAAAVLLWRVVT